MSVDAVANYLLACKKHGVKRPNPMLVKFFQEEEPVAGDIEVIDLSNNYVGNRGILALLDVIEKLPNFRFFNIANQKLYNTDLSEDSVKGNATVDRLVEVFKAHPTANALDISNNPISNYAGRKLLGLVQINTKICRIELTNTRVDFDLRRRISAQCEKNTTAIWDATAGEDAANAPHDAPFGEGKEWVPASRGLDLTALGGSRERRKTRSSEGVDPEKAKNYVAPVYEKTEMEMKLIINLLQHNVLFGFLTSKDLRTVALAMLQRSFKKNDEIMSQGGFGDGLYILEKGNADILKEGQKVYLKTEGTAVGELELMYESPCVATVKVCTDSCVTWYLDRDTYRNLVMGTAIRRRETNMKHLENIPFLSTLDNYEKLQVADALSLDEWEAGEKIITYNTEGEWMYIILEGTVEVIGRKNGEKTYVCDFGAGDYIGELEFLNNHRTVADVVAKTYVCTAKLNRRHFEMCLGPVIDVLRRNMQHPKYEYYQNVLQTGAQPTPEEKTISVVETQEEKKEQETSK